MDCVETASGRASSSELRSSGHLDARASARISPEMNRVRRSSPKRPGVVQPAAMSVRNDPGTMQIHADFRTVSLGKADSHGIHTDLGHRVRKEGR